MHERNAIVGRGIVVGGRDSEMGYPGSLVNLYCAARGFAHSLLSSYGRIVDILEKLFGHLVIVIYAVGILNI